MILPPRSSILALAVAPAHAGQPVEIVESVVVHGNPARRQPRTCWRWSVRSQGNQPPRRCSWRSAIAWTGADGLPAWTSAGATSPSTIPRGLVVIVVDEHEGISEDDLTPGPWKRFSASSMWLPVLPVQEGYGFTYGARLSFVDRLGPRSRISVPLTWEASARPNSSSSALSTDPWRVVGGGGVFRRENPFYEIGDLRQTVWGRVELRRAPGCAPVRGWTVLPGRLRRARRAAQHHRRGHRARHPPRSGAASKRRLWAVRCRASRLRHERARRPRRGQPGHLRRRG